MIIENLPFNILWYNYFAEYLSNNEENSLIVELFDSLKVKPAPVKSKPELISLTTGKTLMEEAEEIMEMKVGGSYEV